MIQGVRHRHGVCGIGNVEPGRRPYTCWMTERLADEARAMGLKVTPAPDVNGAAEAAAGEPGSIVSMFT